MPRSSRARASILPAGPTNTCPSSSSTSPGCSPIMTLGIERPFAKDSLGGGLVELATLASSGRLFKLGKVGRLRDKRLCGRCLHVASPSAAHGAVVTKRGFVFPSHER